MTIGAIDESQRKAATVVGFSYLFALPPAIFAEFYVRGHLVAFGNVAQTAQNIMTHERLFRLGIASNLTVFAVDVVPDHGFLRGPSAAGANRSLANFTGHGLGAD